MNVDRFSRRFAGLERSHGVYVLDSNAPPDPKGKRTGQAWTEPTGASEADWEAHLLGRRGLGMCPIRDDSTCVFGAIDFDRYDVDLIDLDRRVTSHDLPLIVCRTKSGGAHLYLFASEPIEARLIRSKLAEWSVALGCSGSEIFPKQDRLANRDDGGSWINLPYFGGDDTTRYAMRDGASIGLEEFLDRADSLAVRGETLKKIKPKIDGLLDGAPPCIQSLIGSGIGPGIRNEALFALGVFARKKYSSDWEQMLFRLNQEYIDPPLTPKELGAIAKSLDRKDYAYPCKHAALSSSCDRSLCLSREFGVAGAGSDPGVSIEQLKKILTDPPTWTVQVEGKEIQLESTEDLLSQRRFNSTVVEKLNVLPRTIRPQAWERIVQKLLDHVEETEAPPDAGRSGQFMGMVDYFLLERPKAQNKEGILLGKCFIDGGMAYFRSSDLMKFLDAGKMKITAREAWNHLREVGATTKKIKIKHRAVRCWGMPKREEQEVEIDPDVPDEPEF